MDESPSRQEDEDLSPSSPHAVAVTQCDSAPLVWRVEDLRSVRSQGLVGALLGSLPRTPRQNTRLGRPLLLLPEEERLLRERRTAAAAAPPAADQYGGGAKLRLQVQQHQEEQERSYQEQSILALEDRKSALLRAMTSSHTESESGAADEALRGRLEGLHRSFTFPRSAMAVQLSTARAGLSYCTEARAFLQADGPIRGQDESCCIARYQVFKDLRGRGFYLTSAGKFGGDFLVYPGDPLRFHAHFIAVCLSLDECLSLLDVLAVTRLGSNVKKTVLLCSPGPDGRVMYTSLQWSGMVQICGSHRQPCIHTYIHQSAKKFEPLVAEVSRIDHVVAVQCSLGELLVQKFMGTPLDALDPPEHCCGSSIAPHSSSTP